MVLATCEPYPRHERKRREGQRNVMAGERDLAEPRDQHGNQRKNAHLGSELEGDGRAEPCDPDDVPGNHPAGRRPRRLGHPSGAGHDREHQHPASGRGEADAERSEAQPEHQHEIEKHVDDIGDDDRDQHRPRALDTREIRAGRAVQGIKRNPHHPSDDVRPRDAGEAGLDPRGNENTREGRHEQNERARRRERQPPALPQKVARSTALAGPVRLGHQGFDPHDQTEAQDDRDAADRIAERDRPHLERGHPADHQRVHHPHENQPALRNHHRRRQTDQTGGLATKRRVCGHPRTSGRAAPKRTSPQREHATYERFGRGGVVHEPRGDATVEDQHRQAVR